MSGRVTIWMDISECSIVIGCRKCRTYREVFVDEDEARIAGVRHTKAKVHTGQSYYFVTLDGD